MAGKGRRFHFESLAVLCLAAPASAQDFGTDWADRVTRELQEEEAPLSERPPELTFFGGIAYFFDDNIFLADRDEKDDSVWIGFARARLDTQSPKFEGVADLMVSYKHYVEEEDARDHEIRFFGRARYVQPKYFVGVAAIVRRESDPTDILFQDRVERVVTNVVPELGAEVADRWRVELSANAQWVRFEDDFAFVNNMNYRADASAVHHSSEHTDLLWQAGYFEIDYDDDEFADSNGWYVRTGVRGAISEEAHGVVLAGITGARSDELPGTDERDEHTTADVSVHARWEREDRLRLYADYARRFIWSGVADPWQVINRVTLASEKDLTEDVTARLRAQYDRGHSSQGVIREFVSLAANVDWRIGRHLIVDAGVTYRFGEVRGDPPNREFDDWIYHVGGAVKF